MALEDVILRSKAIAPDVSGIWCCAVHPNETEVVVARENGSLVLYGLEYFQNVPHFTQLRHTGGRVGRTITQMAYLDLSGLKGGSAGRFLLASYLSGQIVAYDSETLFPVSVYQRTGGAVWDMAVSGDAVFAALSDGTWHQLQVRLAPSSTGGSASGNRLVPQLELVRIVPGVSGADRALSVAVSPALRMAVGTDDAGNVHAWRLPEAVEEADKAGVSRLRGHQSLWTTRLPKGMALCVAIVGAGGARPVVAVGTSVGDVALLDVQNGDLFNTFSQHRGPVCTLAVDDTASAHDGGGVLYANGWHESLRCYRLHPETGEWYPAEVKRRTHNHEASQLCLLPRHQLLLSASRDGTVLYAPLAGLFEAPAMYVNVSTQQYAYASARDLLMHTRQGRVEVFSIASQGRHWAPLFAHSVSGQFHLSGLWCDPQLRYFVFATDERAVLVHVVWNAGRVGRLEEVCELPAGTGVLDVLFTPTTSSEDNEKEEEEEEEKEKDGVRSSLGSVYVLFDNGVAHVTLAEGYPVIYTAFPLPRTAGEGENGFVSPSASQAVISEGVRPQKLLLQPISEVGNANGGVLLVAGLRGLWRGALSVDGCLGPTDAFALVSSSDVPSFALAPVAAASGDLFSHLACVPRLRPSKGDVKSTTTESEGSSCGTQWIGLSHTEGQYRTLPDYAAQLKKIRKTSRRTFFPRSLPHDVTFVAALPPPSHDSGDAGSSGYSSSSASSDESLAYVAVFSRGVLYVTPHDWRMANRLFVEAAFVMKGGKRVLLIERNMEKSLEALPLCWKVRRFGN